MEFFFIYGSFDPEPFVLCADHLADRRIALSEDGYDSVSLGQLPHNFCAECAEAASDGADISDDGDYPGVEQDENMQRIEGDDFWCQTDYGDEY